MGREQERLLRECSCGAAAAATSMGTAFRRRAGSMMRPASATLCTACAEADAAIEAGSLVINLAACKYDVLASAASQLGYTVLPTPAASDVLTTDTPVASDPSWDLCWTDLSVSTERVARLLGFQRLNHLPGMLELCRKVGLTRHLGRMAVRCPTEYGFYPQSLVLPEQMGELVAALKRNQQRVDSGLAPPAGPGELTTWIIKPSGGTMGRGIVLAQLPGHLRHAELTASVAQAYIPRPALLDGFKFDLRLYVLVSSVDPLRVWLWDEGLARLATTPYAPPGATNLNQARMHLTNHSINKHAPGYVPPDSVPAGAGLGASSGGATKRLASVVLEQLAKRAGTSRAALMRSIEQLVVKTIISTQPALAHAYHTAVSAGCNPPRSACSKGGYDHGAAAAANSSPGYEASTDTLPPHACGCPTSRCFELLGFDILLDERLTPWLLEVNHSPSFATDSQLDADVKGGLLRDTIRALGQGASERHAYKAAACAAQAERLYTPRGPRAGGLPRRPQTASLARVADALDAAVLCDTPRKSQATAAARPPHHKIAARVLPDSAGTGIQGSLGLIPRDGPGADAAQGGLRRVRMGGFTQVYPPPDGATAARYLALLATAADVFPDQRCGCAYCARRARIRYQQAAAARHAGGKPPLPPFVAMQPPSFVNAAPARLRMRPASATGRIERPLTPRGSLAAPLTADGSSVALRPHTSAPAAPAAAVGPPPAPTVPRPAGKPPLVPRVALLAEAGRRMGSARSPRGPSAAGRLEVGAQVLLLRVATAAALSNRFVSLRISDTLAEDLHKACPGSPWVRQHRVRPHSAAPV